MHLIAAANFGIIKLARSHCRVVRDVLKFGVVRTGAKLLQGSSNILIGGKAKEIVGKVIGNPNLQDRGTVEKTAGKVQRKVGDVKKVFGK